jgi:hypothetical protein
VNDILSTLGLSAEQLALRKDALGGSDANVIMGGDEKKLLRLWREKRGEAEPEDLSDILAVQMGSFTEPLNVAWFEKNTGYRRDDDGARASDATRDRPSCAARSTGGSPAPMWCEPVFRGQALRHALTDAEIFARYVPQLTHNALCAGEGRLPVRVQGQRRLGDVRIRAGRRLRRAPGRRRGSVLGMRSHRQAAVRGRAEPTPSRSAWSNMTCRRSAQTSGPAIAPTTSKPSLPPIATRSRRSR